MSMPHLGVLLGRRLAAVVVAGIAATCASASEPTVIVEEDWELVVSDPDARLCAPQVVCVLSPGAATAAPYAAFEINHQSQPKFAAGGLTLQVFAGDQPIGCHRWAHAGILGVDGETVRWTQRMTLEEGRLRFEVLDGTSTTWGDFGGGALSAQLDSSLPSLDGYSYEASAENSGVTYAGNRVAHLRLRAVRRYSASGLLEDKTFDLDVASAGN